MIPGSSTQGGGHVEAGQTLAPVRVTLTLQRLVMEAGANRDFAPIHFDREAARESGAPQVYANTTLIETVFEALLRGWAGLAGLIRVLEFSMQSFNCVGDEITAGGEVTSVRQEGEQRLAELKIWIDGPRGRTVSGSALVAFRASSVLIAP